MIDNYYNTTKLLEKLYIAMNGIGAKTFTSSRMMATSDLETYVVVSVPVKMINRGAFGSTTCRISLYAKDTKLGENVKSLGNMQDEVYSRLPLDNELFTTNNPITIPAGSDNAGYHCVHIQTDVTLKHK